jgi:PAS domain S-box-containing protein
MMRAPDKTRFVRSLERLPGVAALASVSVGVLVLLGWQADASALKSLLPGLVAMNPLTALAFILAGVSLGALRGREDQPAHRWVGNALATTVLALGVAKLCDVILHTQLDLDQLLFRSRLSATAGLPPNRMAPNTAACLALLGAGLLSLRWELRRHVVSQYLALLLAGVSLLAILGYVLDVQALYGVKSFIPMALNTALVFGTLSLAILSAYPERGVVGVLVAADGGGTMARRTLPFAVAVPVLLAWIRIQADRQGILPAEFGVSVMVFASIVLLTALIWSNAMRLSAAERERKAALEALQTAHGELEQRVRARTAELEAANERLQNEVDERQRSDQALRDSEVRYRLLFLGNPHPMWVYDRQGLAFLAVNEAAVQLYGYAAEEFMSMTLRDIWPSDEVPSLLEDVATDRPEMIAPREWRHVRKDGTLVAVEIASHTLQFAGRDAALVLATDVTRRKQLEKQLRQSQKMEAIGQLAGGVAHDFNNLLTAIMGYSQLMRRRLAADSPALRDTDEILKAAERAAGLTRQLLAFSRQQVLEPKVLDLNAIVTDLDKMLRRLIGEDIDLVTATAEGLGRVKADPGQLEQVLMNLVVNARDAMPEGGKLTIETANVDLDEGYAQERVELRPGRYVMVAVSDTGCGMSPEVTAQIFEPFFTTKEQGKGTGLGLSTVHGIVKQSEGHIEVYSEPGHGTTFKVYLPRVEGAADMPQAPRAAAERHEGHETVLLVEDEEVIRRIVTETLELDGYRVIAVEDGSRGIAVCERKDQVIDLLITDVVMPLMSGPQLVQRVASLRPDLPVLYISGYTDRALIHQGQRAAGTAFLQKPFTPEVLARKVREVLAEPRQRAA